jgi:hypothetical protein
MYNPPSFLTPEVLAQVLAAFPWPATYVLEDDRPDGIEIRLPRCHLYATEGFESNMDLKFLPESTGLDVSVSVVDAITALCADPHRTLPQRPKLIACFSPQASLEKVKNELRDLLTLLFTYLEPSLHGDFDWVSAYRISGRGHSHDDRAD